MSSFGGATDLRGPARFRTRASVALQEHGVVVTAGPGAYPG
jgi:hypothetical protein